MEIVNHELNEKGSRLRDAGGPDVVSVSQLFNMITQKVGTRHATSEADVDEDRHVRSTRGTDKSE